MSEDQAATSHPIEAVPTQTEPQAAPRDTNLENVIAEVARQGSPRSPAEKTSAPSQGIGAVLDIPVRLDVVMTALDMTVSDLMAMAPGQEIDLARSAGEPVSLMVNGHVVAYGELFLIDRESRQVGVRVTALNDADLSASRV